jgi:hypothetical protein
MDKAGHIRLLVETHSRAEPEHQGGRHDLGEELNWHVDLRGLFVGILGVDFSMECI